MERTAYKLTVDVNMKDDKGPAFTILSDKLWLERVSYKKLQTDIQTERDTERRTDQQTDRETDRQRY